MHSRVRFHQSCTVVTILDLLGRRSVQSDLVTGIEAVAIAKSVTQQRAATLVGAIGGHVRFAGTPDRSQVLWETLPQADLPVLIGLGVNDLWTFEPDPHPGSLAGALNQLVTGGSGRSRDLQRQPDAPHLPE